MEVCYSLFWALLPHTLLHFYWDYLRTIFYRQGSCNWAKYPLVHSLPCPGIHLRSIVKGVPLDTEVSCTWQTLDVISRMHVAMYSFQKMVHRQNVMLRLILRLTHASQMLVSPA